MEGSKKDKFLGVCSRRHIYFNKLQKRPIQFVFDIGNPIATAHFYKKILGMKVRQHEKLREGAVHAFKHKLGYGPDHTHFVIEITCNYEIKSYERGEDFLGMTIQSSEALKRARNENLPIEHIGGDQYMVTAPDGYQFNLIDKPQPTDIDPIRKVTLGTSSIESCKEFWADLVGLKSHNEKLGSIEFRFAADEATMEFIDTGKQGVKVEKDDKSAEKQKETGSKSDKQSSSSSDGKSLPVRSNSNVVGDTKSTNAKSDERSQRNDIEDRNRGSPANNQSDRNRNQRHSSPRDERSDWKSVGFGEEARRRYVRFLAEGYKPEEARRKARDRSPERSTSNNDQPSAGSKRKSDVIDLTLICEQKKRKMAPAGSTIKVAVFTARYSDDRLTASDLPEVERAFVREMIDGAQFELRFVDITFQSGCVIIDCLDPNSADWALNIAPGLKKWKGAELWASYIENIKTIILPRSAGEKAEDMIKLIGVQNRSFNTKSWRVIRTGTEDDALVVQVVVDDTSEQAIAQRNHTMNFRFGKVKMHGLEDRPAFSAVVSKPSDNTQSSISVENEIIADGDVEALAEDVEKQMEVDSDADDGSKERSETGGVSAEKKTANKADTAENPKDPAETKESVKGADTDADKQTDGTSKELLNGRKDGEDVKNTESESQDSKNGLDDEKNKKDDAESTLDYDSNDDKETEDDEADGDDTPLAKAAGKKAVQGKKGSPTKKTTRRK